MFKLPTVLLCLSFALTLVLSEPTRCYYCDVTDFENCNSPINVTEIGTIDCSTVVGRQNTTSEMICYTLTTSWLMDTITERGCYHAELDGKDFCTYMIEQAGIAGVFSYNSCETCDSDECNNQ